MYQTLEIYERSRLTNTKSWRRLFDNREQFVFLGSNILNLINKNSLEQARIPRNFRMFTFYDDERTSREELEEEEVKGRKRSN